MLLHASTTSEEALIATWQNVSWQINCYFSIFLFLFGLIGNTLNIFVLSQRSLRSNPCAWLFLLSSFANLVVILAGLPTRIISSWTPDITDTLGWACKLRIFVLYTSRTIASWLIILASIDRWLLSCLNAHRRQLSTLKHVQYGALMVVLFSTILFSPLFYCYEANLVKTPLRCYTKSMGCRLFAEQTYTCVTILFPLILMLLFGFMTLSNVRQSKCRARTPLLSRTGSSTNSHRRQRRFKSIDRHLLIMLLVQISFMALLTLPQAIQQIYSTITQNRSKPPLQVTIENCVFSFVLLLTYLASGLSFYIYTLSGGHVFQEAFFVLMRRIKRTIVCQRK